ncbi:polymorphic toxin type 24 domain-containing protein [Parasphingorhabdus pacifica]
MFKETGLEIAGIFEDLFGDAEPPPPPPPPEPIYQRDAPLPHARELIAHGTEWTQSGRNRGKFPLTAEPSQVLYKQNPHTGEITNYSVYDDKGYIIKRVDLAGSPHGGVDTPHVSPP